MENNFVQNNEVDFWYCICLYYIYLYLFYKMVNFHFVLVRIVVDHEKFTEFEFGCGIF